MKIIHHGKGYVYRFICDCCGSELEAEREEMTLRRLGDNIYDYNCPVCDEKRSICRDAMRKIFLE